MILTFEDSAARVLEAYPNVDVKVHKCGLPEIHGARRIVHIRVGPKHHQAHHHPMAVLHLLR